MQPEVENQLWRPPNYNYNLYADWIYHFRLLIIAVQYSH